MAVIPVTPRVVQDIVDTEAERTFWEVVRHHERPPFHFPEEGVNNRLNLAARLVYEEHVHPQSDGSFQVDGSGGRVYRVADSCSCPYSQKSKTKWCKHLVATALYVEWQRRLKPLAPTFSPVALGTLRAGTAPLPREDEALPLPLPPVTVDERLAQATASAMDAVHRALETDRMPQEDLISTPSNRGEAISTELVAGLHDREGSPRQCATLGESTSLPLGQTDSAPGFDNALQLQDKYGGITPEPDRVSPQAGAFSSGESVPSILLPMQAIPEDLMTEDAEAYIPEPDDVPVAVEDAPVPTRALTPVAPQVLDLEVALQTWTSERAVVRRFLKQELQANIDYYTLRIGGKDSKPSLSKAGAEKVMGWLKLQASFTPDTGTWEMLGKPQDLVCYVCTLRTRSGEIVGEGRGARSIKKDGGDVNKAIKMAEKSANVSAVLRTGCLSDVFTQDLGEDDEEPAKPTTPAKTTSQDLRMRIWKIVQSRAPEVTSRDEAEVYIKTHTGMDLHPDFYQAIVNRLEEGR
jgi:hypothetical protein